MRASQNPEAVAKLKRIATRARDDYFFLCQKILGYKDVRPSPHQELCDSIEKEGKRKKLILMPRGSFKSSCVTVGYTIRSILRNPDIRILISSETQKNAKRFVNEIKSHFEGNQKLKALFGDWRGDRIWRDDEFLISKRSRVLKESTVTAASLEKMTVVGQHYDMIILDDPVSQHNVNNPDQINRTIDHYKLLLSVLDPGIDKKIVVLGTRWSLNDLYGWILDPSGTERDQFDIVEKQAIDDEGKLLLPHVLTKEFLAEARKTQGDYIFSCNPGEAPILMADWTVKRIDQVEVGDKLVGFEFNSQGRRSRLVETTVLETFNREADVVKLTMETGHQIRCTPDHHWYVGRFDKSHRPYLPAKVGRRLFRVLDCSYKPNESEISDYRYLAGLVDGEGACKYGSINITQSRTKNPLVHQAILDVLGRLKIPYAVYDYERKECSMISLQGGRDIKHRLIQWGRLAKAPQVVSNIFRNGSRLVGGKRGNGNPKIVSIEESGRERVYSLKTTTGNYVAWGYASKNCQYLNRAISSETATFNPSQIKYYDTPPHGLIYFITLDPAVSTGAYADFSGIIVNGVDSEHNWYIIEALQLKVAPAELINKIFELVERYQPMMCLGMEKYILEKFLKVSFTEEMLRRNTFFAMKEIDTDNKVSKEVRIRSLQPRFQSGQVYLRKDQTVLYNQIVFHPQLKNDDLIDALKSQIAITFPAPQQAKSPEDKYAHLPDREKKIWLDVDKVARRRVKQMGRYDI